MARIKEDVIHTIEIKKSKFITYLHRTDSEEDAKDFLKMIKKEHPDATHHCTAMVLGSIVRSNDDGEPAGTAGHPMLNVLQGNKIEDVLAIVVRYFGGTKLGTGGLVKAYTQAVKEALQKACLTTVMECFEFELTYGYEFTGKMDTYFRSKGIEIIDQSYDQKITVRYISLYDNTKEIQEWSNGKLSPIFIQKAQKEKTMDLCYTK